MILSQEISGWGRLRLIVLHSPQAKLYDPARMVFNSDLAKSNTRSILCMRSCSANILKCTGNPTQIILSVASGKCDYRSAAL